MKLRGWYYGWSSIAYIVIVKIPYTPAGKSISTASIYSSLRKVRVKDISSDVLDAFWKAPANNCGLPHKP
jgi:hypothetical protein